MADTYKKYIDQIHNFGIAHIAPAPPTREERRNEPMTAGWRCTTKILACVNVDRVIDICSSDHFARNHNIATHYIDNLCRLRGADPVKLARDTPKKVNLWRAFNLEAVTWQSTLFNHALTGMLAHLLPEEKVRFERDVVNAEEWE